MSSKPVQIAFEAIQTDSKAEKAPSRSFRITH